MSRSTLLECWTKFLDGGALSSEELEELRACLDQDPAIRQVLLDDWALDGLLRSRVLDEETGRRFTAGMTTLLAAQADQGRFAERLRAAIGRSPRAPVERRRRTWQPLALAAGLLVTVLGAWSWGHGWLAGREEEPTIAGNHQTVHPGDVLHLEPQVELVWRDGTRAVVQSSATIALMANGQGKHLTVDAGSLRIHAAPQPAAHPMAISSRYATATVVGTDFTFAVTGAEARLEVEHGSVRFGIGDGRDLLVSAGSSALADRFGARDAAGPLFHWSADSASSPSPSSGRLGKAPDGQPCLVATDTAGLTVINFIRSNGWFASDPRSIVTCRVWIGKQVAWAGFYFQDTSHQHHAQWHLPLDIRGAWRDLRFSLADVVRTNGPPLAPGDIIEYFMLQAQFAPSAEIFLKDLKVSAPSLLTSAPR
jgi:ferric-dicitrate binding protein FerR (iron transport regulator)